MNERTQLAVFLALALVGVAVFATIGLSTATDVQVAHGKAEARGTATEFLDSQGYDVSGYETSVVFDSDRRAGVYIQRKLPLERAGEAFERHSVYTWEVRFYRPLNQTEFFVYVDPTTGEVVRFRREVPDGAPGGRLSAETAKRRARALLEERGHDLSSYELVQNASTDLENRRDHTFTWRRRDGGVADAPEKVTVVIQGERVGEYVEYLDVPDGFVHHFEIQQNRNDLLGSVAGFLMLGTVILALGFAVRYYRRGELAVRKAGVVGGVVALVTFAHNLNELPGTLHYIPTTTTTFQYLAQNVIQILIGSLVLGLVSGVLYGAGAGLVREFRGKRLVGDADPETTVRRLKHSTFRGFCVGWALLGFVTLFYWLGARYFEVWQPVGTPYTQAMSAFLPAIAVLYVGLLPAVMEELIFRAVGISLGSRYLRYAAVAVAVTAMVWAFGHSQYIVLPPYARFVELTIVGVVLGGLFIRYDLLTVVAAHFTFNATLTAVPMLTADLPFVVANGVLGLGFAVLPLLVAVGTVAYDRREPGRLEARLTPEPVATDAVRDVLASTDERVLTTREVAAELDAPEDVVEAELQTLADAGAVASKDVPGGGTVWWSARDGE